MKYSCLSQLVLKYHSKLHSQFATEITNTAIQNNLCRKSATIKLWYRSSQEMKYNKIIVTLNMTNNSPAYIIVTWIISVVRTDFNPPYWKKMELFEQNKKNFNEKTYNWSVECADKSNQQNRHCGTQRCNRT